MRRILITLIPLFAAGTILLMGCRGNPVPTPAQQPSPSPKIEQTVNQTIPVASPRITEIVPIPAPSQNVTSSANQTISVNQTPNIVTPTLPPSPAYTPVQEYAKSRGLSPEIINALKPLGALDDNIKGYIDLLALGERAYPSLFKQLVKLPELKKIDEVDLEAVDDIYNLASSDNTEVRKAFDLMIKARIYNPYFYKYDVPDWNTQLGILYNLALQNEFRKDDTLAQAIAIDNGIWVTMGDDEVKLAAYNDSNELLNFMREINETQKAKGYYQLENYPLEAKICLCWTGGKNIMPYFAREYSLSNHVKEKLDLKSYEWDTVSIDTLRKMREIMNKNSWLKKEVDKTVGNLDYYFYFNLGYNGFGSTHWIWPGWEKFIPNGNVDDLFRDYLDDEVVTGGCGEEQSLVNAFSKSVGIATNSLYGIFSNAKSGSDAHDMTIFYDPSTESWKAYEKQLNIWSSYKSMEDNINYYFFEVPSNPEHVHSSIPFNIQVYINFIYGFPANEAKGKILNGIPTSFIEQMLFSRY